MLEKETEKQENIRIKTLQNQLQATEKAIENIKTFLNEIEYKVIETRYIQYTSQDKQAKELDKRISDLEQETKQIEQRKTQLQKSIIQRES